MYLFWLLDRPLQCFSAALGRQSHMASEYANGALVKQAVFITAVINTATVHTSRLYS